jgi:hypothetical protein
MSKAGKRIIAAAKEAVAIARDPTYVDKKGRRYRAIVQINKSPSLESQLIKAQDEFGSDIACIYGNEDCPICNK